MRVEYNLTAAEDPLVLVREDGTGSAYRFPEQPARSVETKNLDVTAGRWLLVCDLQDHAANGMQTTLLVR